MPDPGAAPASTRTLPESALAREKRRIGRAATLLLGTVLLTWAVSIDFAKVSSGFFSDAATYYGLAHSLAQDGDFEYRREDLVRVWHEFPSGPEGIFLKRGRDVDLSVSADPPFLRWSSTPDPDEGRLFYAKGYMFPLAAAPFVWLFGTNGFLVLHALLMTLCFGCAYAFLAARGESVPALAFAAVFLLISVAPVYMVWLTPDFFNFATVLIGYFFWAYKEVAATTLHEAGPRSPWLRGLRSDIVAALFLAVATFSKPTLVPLAGPLLGALLFRRQWARLLIVGAVFAFVVIALFGINIAITGEWNYQGGDRRTFYSGQGGFPFQTDTHGFDALGFGRATNSVPVEVIGSRDAVLDVFGANLGYFLFGRHTGFLPYFFPAVVAIALFLFSRAPRALWQWLTLAGGVIAAVGLILYMPFTYSGGGGPVGNRYYLGAYAVFLFLTPPLIRITPAVVAALVSGVFTAQLVANPFYVSFRPGEHTKTGVFRWLPVELSLLNDLPVNVSPSRIRQPLGGSPPVSAYFLDDNAYNRENDAFWVRGGSRADLMLRAPVAPIGGEPNAPLHSFRMPQVQLDLESGPVPNRVTVRTAGERRVIDLPASNRQQLVVEMGEGLPYKPFPELPTNYVYSMSIESESAFIPMFVSGSRDNRVLGVFVRLVPIYDAPPAISAQVPAQP